MNRTLRLLRPLQAGTVGPRPLTVLRRSTLIAAPASNARPAFPLSPLSPSSPIALGLSRRYAASTSSGGDGPGKQDDKASASGKKAPGHHVDHQNATSSASSEIRGAARDVADMISGRGSYPSSQLAMESSSHGHGGSITEDFASITKGLFLAIPKSALYFGAAGVLPYLGTSVATIGLAREAALAASPQGSALFSLTDALSYLHTVEHVQITYGAIILSFLGAIHWGMEFSQQGGEQGWRRLAVGTVPVLFAWPTTFMTHGVALAMQWAGFTGMWFLDQRATQNGWTTSWYSTYRFYLSIIVGFSIIATLAGTGYYGAGAGAVNDAKARRSQHTTERISPNKRLDRVKEKSNPKVSGKQTGTVPGDMEVDEREDGEGYLTLRNIAKEKEEDEAKKKEEEEKKQQEQKEKAELQDKKDEGQQDHAPGDMKSDAKDRTGKNRNQPGGEEKAEDDKAKGMDEAVRGKKAEEGTTEKAKGDTAKGASGNTAGKEDSGDEGDYEAEGDKKDEGGDKKGGGDDKKDKSKDAKASSGGDSQKAQGSNSQDGQDGSEGKGGEQDKGAAGKKNTGMK